MSIRYLKVFAYLSEYLFYSLQKNSDEAVSVIYRAVSNLGGLYVKLVQFICLRTDIFNESDKVRFLSFYDAVPLEPMDVRSILVRELGSEILSQFLYISDQPFASGTFGQVYRGVLRDRTEIVIKIQRPGIRLKLLTDFVLLKLAAYFFNFFHYQRIIDVHGLLQEFEELTYRELDYRKEVRNALYFHDVYHDHPYIVVPRTFPQYSTSRILVQEYVGGIPLTEIIESSWRGTNILLSHESLRLCIQRIAFTLGIQGLTQSIFYADPHPGNIKVLPGGRIAFIDFGIVGVSPQNRRTYYHIIELILEHSEKLDMKEIGREFLKWGAGDFYKLLATYDAQNFHQDRNLTTLVTDKYAYLLEMYREQFRSIEALEEENFSKMYLEIIRAGELLGVKVPQGMLATMRTVAIFKSWATAIDPAWHGMRAIYKEIINAVDQHYLYNKDEINPSKVDIEDALEGILDWATRVAEKDPPWFTILNREINHLYA